jgi:hypothetical protein
MADIGLVVGHNHYRPLVGARLFGDGELNQGRRQIFIHGHELPPVARDDVARADMERGVARLGALLRHRLKQRLHRRAPSDLAESGGKPSLCDLRAFTCKGKNFKDFIHLDQPHRLGANKFPGFGKIHTSQIGSTHGTGDVGFREVESGEKVCAEEFERLAKFDKVVARPGEAEVYVERPGDRPRI